MKVETHSVDEKFVFKPGTKKAFAILIVIGIVLLGLGIFLESKSSGHENEHAKEEEVHKKSEDLIKPVPSHSRGEALLDKIKRESYINSESHDSKPHEKGFAGEHITSKKETEEAHGEEYTWIKRLYSNLWINNVFFAGLAIIGVFFYALQYAASAGWSTALNRIPLAFGNWLPIAGILMLGTFFIAQHDLFHWTHPDLFDKGSSHYDEIIDGKKGYLNIPFYLIRMVVYFLVWFIMFSLLKREAVAEDLDGDSRHYVRSKWIAAFFIIFFAVTNSMSSWDWIMSIDTHWFSTMFGWYSFASWWVSGLAAITLVVVYLKENGYLSFINQNHLHDLGKFVFAFSIFWTYVWFAQFFLIYYANIPEEGIYFMERLNNAKYAPIFYLNIFLNFIFPFLLLMTRDAKRQNIFLKIVCCIVLVGHWLDFWLMVTPGTLKQHGSLGFMEIGLTLIFGGAFLFTVFSSLAKLPLVAKNHPMLEESIHHHI